MTDIDARELLMPFRIADGAGAGSKAKKSDGPASEGAILFDAQRLRQAAPEWFDPLWWGPRAQAVASGGRGGAWFVNMPSSPEGRAPLSASASKSASSKAASSKSASTPAVEFGPAVLRHYLRGGLAAKFSRDRHLWRGPAHVRSFQEFRLLCALRAQGLPVPRPIAAVYWRHTLSYRAAILLERLLDVRSLAELAAGEDDPALWRRCGELIARLHCAGLDHADLNAHNILFRPDGEGWIIDLDRSRIRPADGAWREANLRRLERSLLKLRGERSPQRVQEDVRRLREAYDTRWRRGA